MKVLKTAAIVIGAAVLVATGVGAAAAGVTLGTAFAGVTAAVGTTLGISAAAAGIVSGALGGLALFAAAEILTSILPKPSASSGTQTKWKGDPYAGVPYPMGRTLTGGNIVYRRGSGGDNTYEHFVTVLGLTLAGIDTTFMNKTTVAFDGSGAATGTYAGQIWQRSQLGACPESAALTPGAGTAPGWTSAHKLSGLAATFLTFKYDAKEKNGLTTEPAPAWIVRGVKVYDPRLDSTYPGGSGACRAYDESTYVWSENPHLHALTWAMGRVQNGKRVAGIGGSRLADRASIKGVDVASFVEGANLDDARGWKIGGQVVTRPDTLWNSLKAMLQAGGAKPALVRGVITSINRAPRVSLATITRQDIVGRCSFSGTQPRRSRINTVIPQYRSEAHDWQMVSASAVTIGDFVTLDGDERTKELPYPLVQQVNQAAQLAIYDIYDAREAGPGSIPLKPWWLNFKLGDCVTFEPEDGFTTKVMIVDQALEASTGVVTYSVVGETDGKHALALGQTGEAPPVVSLTYSTGAPTPTTAEWSLAGVSLEANGSSIPALVATGEVASSSVDAIIFAYRPYVAGQGSEAGWSAGALEGAATTRREFGTVTPGTQYEVSIQYRLRGQVSERLILGPVTSGDLGTASTGASRFIALDPLYPLTSDDDSINAAAFSGVLTTGEHVSFSAATATGLAAYTRYEVFIRRSTGELVAAVYPAASLFADTGLIYIYQQSTADADGLYPEDPTPPGGRGGGGGGVQP